MTQEEKGKDIADIQIRISQKTLEAIEKHGTYADKNPEGILKRILPELDELKKTCPAALPSEKEEIPDDGHVKKPEEKQEESEKIEDISDE
ncbi:hypothetical protein KKH23_04520 [Patescibacteria group bacterium]|nr:hypothetical protein [Patescibacteria group bacterium]